MTNFRALLKQNILYVAWAQTLIATIGSLFLSDAMKLPPCSLCWYQRVFMFPLVFILTVGILKKDRSIHLYVLPLSIIGMAVALYHTLLQAGIIPESFAPCTADVSCVTKYLEIYNFITIPLLSLLAFTVISACVIIFNSLHKET